MTMAMTKVFSAITIILLISFSSNDADASIPRSENVIIRGVGRGVGAMASSSAFSSSFATSGRSTTRRLWRQQQQQQQQQRLPL